jgi:2-polyprenyl-3-methyl-5-hydroxy-6-metoxy-1,4-benzoquinol methylase
VSGDTCAVCGGPTASAFVASDRNRRLSNERFSYRRCAWCGTLALVAVPDNLDRYYPSEYYTLPNDRDALLAAVGAEQYKVDMLRRFVPGGRLIEIGPAIGGFAVLAQEAGYQVSAVEMDARCCRFLRDVVGIETQESDDPAGALRAFAPFDAVAMWHVIEHLRDPAEVLKAAAAAVRPGGVVVLAAPNPEAFQFRVLGSRWTHLDAPRHLFLIPAGELARIGSELGLEVALLTTSDAGTLGWNVFGWRESLAGFAQGRYSRHGLKLLGSLVAGVMRPLDRRDRHGSTYTLVLRRPLPPVSADRDQSRS